MFTHDSVPIYKIKLWHPPANDANAAAFAQNQKRQRQAWCRSFAQHNKTAKHQRSTCSLIQDCSDTITTLTVLPLAPLPCRMQGSIVATAPCLFIPAAAAAILGRQRRDPSRFERTIPRSTSGFVLFRSISISTSIGYRAYIFPVTYVQFTKKNPCPNKYLRAFENSWVAARFPPGKTF